MSKQKPAKSPDSDGCYNCRFWRENLEPGQEGRSGECRPGPPTVLYDGENIFCTWAQTADTEWCGAHQQRLQ